MRRSVSLRADVHRRGETDRGTERAGRGVVWGPLGGRLEKRLGVRAIYLGPVAFVPQGACVRGGPKRNHERIKYEHA